MKSFVAAILLALFAVSMAGYLAPYAGHHAAYYAPVANSFSYSVAQAHPTPLRYAAAPVAHYAAPLAYGYGHHGAYAAGYGLY